MNPFGRSLFLAVLAVGFTTPALRAEPRKSHSAPLYPTAVFSFEERGNEVKGYGRQVTDLLVAELLQKPDMVLVDRVDEPYLINGSTELMKSLVWPMLDNKFLKHPGLGIKLLLPIELERLIDRESSEFHQRARLDKQNLIRSLAWTGQSLYDVANARITACAAPDHYPELTRLFEDQIDPHRLTDAFATLRVPRHMFKFMYRLFTTHCNAHSDENPVWKISSGTFESVLALYQRDQEAFDRGEGAG